MTNVTRITGRHRRQCLTKADQVNEVNSHPISGNQGIYIQPCPLRVLPDDGSQLCHLLSEVWVMVMCLHCEMKLQKWGTQVPHGQVKYFPGESINLSCFWQTQQLVVNILFSICITV